MHSTSLRTAIFVLLAQCVPSVLTAQISDAIGTASLSGLTGFAISVEELSPDLEGAGLNANQLRMAAAQKLQAAGIAVIPLTGWIDSAGCAELYLEVSALRNGEAQFCYSLKLSVIQKVLLAGNGRRQTLAGTWLNSMIGVAGPGSIAGTIRTGAGEEIDAFIGGYRLANHPPEK